MSVLAEELFRAHRELEASLLARCRAVGGPTVSLELRVPGVTDDALRYVMRVEIAPGVELTVRGQYPLDTSIEQVEHAVGSRLTTILEENVCRSR